MAEQNKSAHPGARIKLDVIPKGMSVTKAAQLAGVGRPALSNLINGNSALSADMAARLSVAFGVPRKELLEMQAKYDAELAKGKMTPAATISYVPPFLGIKANQIEDWADHNIPARTRLPVFLRTLVNSTGRSISKIDFPGNDDAERPGWDGLVEASEGTPWIPIGRSGWEFGVDKNVKKKADNDFEKSIKAIDKVGRHDMVFVFVTPRRWAGKAAWVADAKAKEMWKDVRAYDASDLEQWVEQSVAAQVWFANENNMPTQEVRSLDKCWTDWANVVAPPLVGTFFDSAIEDARRIMISRLGKVNDGPTIIAADSTDEALAFLAQLFGEKGGEELGQFRDKVLVFDAPSVLPKLAEGAQTFIAVISNREAERELAPYAKSISAILVHPRNAANADPHVILEPANHETFNKALEEMGKDRDEISRLSKASGQSLTVLRRQLSTVPAVRTPSWAADAQAAVRLIPFLFVGAWNSQNEADKQGLSLLANDRKYEELEKDCQKLSQLNDAPVWSIGTFRGVISKIDLLYAVAGYVTFEDLNRYFQFAGLVLGEDDPSLDLPEGERWAAAMRGKTREFSSAFREGISETLVLLAVHGNDLFKGRLGFDTAYQSSLVVRELLKAPLTTRLLEASDRDLPLYAEASPEEFLFIFESDLKASAPATLGLLRPINVGLFGHSSRTGLLWALEGLAWNPETLPRAALILARLAQVEISDNLANKPINSLESIFRAWMPQTAASHEVRLSLMKKLAETFPSVAWKICVAQFGSFNDVGHYTHKPRWRPDGFGFGEPFPTVGPRVMFQREMVEMALTWPEHSLTTLSDLVERLNSLDSVYQARVWSLIEAWASTGASEEKKTAMREKIRVNTMSRRALIRSKRSTQNVDLVKRAREAYAALEPKNVLHKHAWLFRENWVEESADEIEDLDELDFRKRDERIQSQRLDALLEIKNSEGLVGLIELADSGNAAWAIGLLVAQNILQDTELVELLRISLSPFFEGQEAALPRRNLVSGALHAIPDDSLRTSILDAVADGLRPEDFVNVLVLAPFGRSTWAIVDALSGDAQLQYWGRIRPSWLHHSDSENNEAVERLLKFQRPLAAFSIAEYHPEKLDGPVLFRLLSEMAAGGTEKADEYLPKYYYVEKAFQQLDTVSSIAVDQKAVLEFAFIGLLARSWDRGDEKYGIPNLERHLEAHPEVFVQAITWVYKRKDGSEDPEEYKLPADRVVSMAERGYKLLDALRRIPGHNDLGELETNRLTKWVDTVRQMGAELSRGDITDHCIGHIFAFAPVGSDGVWPCEPVRQVMEEVQSKSMMEGVRMGIYNSRGAHWRGEGGGQEREIADKYRIWAQELRISHPYVSSQLLMEIVRTYEYDANREDLEAGIRRRLH
jgi:addiction module HigA family antidote